MAKIKFHTVAAVVVAIAAGAWVATGEFASVGSAAKSQEAAPAAGAQEQAAAEAESAGSEPAAAQPAALKTVAFVKPIFMDHNRVIRISGVTEADKQTTLAARAGGVIGKLEVDEGVRVNEGDIVMSLDVEDKAAMVDTAKAVLDQRQKEFEAMERLVARGTAAKLQADTARSALAAAQSQLQQAEADLDRLKVKVPFPGVIDQVMVEQGSFVQAGAPIAVLLKLDPIVARAEVNEQDLGYVTDDTVAEVRLVSGKTVEGKVRHISRIASAQTRTFPVEIEIPNADGTIPAGMTAEIALQTESVKAVLLPRSVVTLSANGDLGIRILNADDTVGFVPIDLIDDTPRGLVLGSVPADARIIVAGQDLVTEGETVKAVEADAAMLSRLVGELTGSTN